MRGFMSSAVPLLILHSAGLSAGQYILPESDVPAAGSELAGVIRTADPPWPAESPAVGSVETDMPAATNRHGGRPQPVSSPSGHWKVLVLIFPDTDVDYLDSGGAAQHYDSRTDATYPTLSAAQIAQAYNVAASYENLVESWSDGLCLITLDVKTVGRAIDSLTVYQTSPRSYWVGVSDIQPELAAYMGALYQGTGNYDSVITVWNSGPIPTAGYAGLTYYITHNGLTLTHTLIPFKHVLPPAGEVTGEIMVHEWLHGVDDHFSNSGYSVPNDDTSAALGYAPGNDPVYGRFGHFYRDILRGQVEVTVGSDFEYTGISPAVWHAGSVRAGTHQRPYPVQLLSPVADVCTSGTTPTLKWASVPADTYRVKIYDTAAPATPVASTETAQTSWTVPPGLLAVDKLYEWTIESVSGGFASTDNDRLHFTTTPAGQLSMPAFNPDGGAFASFLKVTVTCATPGVRIHFTTSGADPTSASPWVDSGAQVTVLAPGTLKAKAYNDSCTPGAVKTASYTAAPVNLRVVTTTADSGAGSLRQAIADANLASDMDRIVFSIPGGGVQSIALAGPFPEILFQTVIDGWTQPGFAGVPLIELNGAGAGLGASGLRFTGGNSVVRGLIVNRFSSTGVYLGGPGGNLVIGNYIGTNASGNAAAGNTGVGVYVESPGNLVGGAEAAWRNVISSNYRGIFIGGAAASGNGIQGNYIGTDIGGNLDLGNVDNGVFIYAAPANTVGGALTGQRNVISGNGLGGVEVSGAGAAGNLVQGNYIGTNVAGGAAIGNTYNGVVVTAADNTIRGNVISGNRAPNVGIMNTQAILLEGNHIGINAAGTAAINNGGEGVVVENSANNTIGGTSSTSRNIISGNAFSGIVLAGANSSGNQILGNFIGTDKTGIIARPNGSAGVLLAKMLSGGATPGGNTIGGSATGAGNVISANGSNGVTVSGMGNAGNLVQGNLIGTDLTGTRALGNGGSGVRLTFPGGFTNGASSNQVGGTGSARNIISGNAAYGVAIIGTATGATGNLVQGNCIGTNLTGTAAIPNALDGVIITTNVSGGNAPDNTIGGVAGEGNVISANGGAGVRIEGAGAISNKLYGNLIGSDAGVAFGLPNAGGGVAISAANNAVGGGTNVTNTIAYNTGPGISVTSGTGNSLRINSIFSNSGLGIDLAGDGVTPNDAGDGDSGPNARQNFPVVTAAVVAEAGTILFGAFSGAAGAVLDLDFYASDACDPAGYGEGRTFLGTAHMVAGGGGDLQFILMTPVAVAAGQFVTATATGSDASTSEFGPCANAYQAAACDIDGDGDVDGLDRIQFEACATGPTIPGPPAGCPPDRFNRFDADDDGDVDQVDFARFQGCYGGADRPAQQGCG